MHTERLRTGAQYSKQDIYKLLEIPAERQRGDWDTGYHHHDGESFIFANIGVPGRTGHDYANYWIGSDLHWQSKLRTTLYDKSTATLLEPGRRVHVFTREQDRDPWLYEGNAYPIETEDTIPATVIWRFSPGQGKPEASPQEVPQGQYTEGAVQRIEVNAYERNPRARMICLLTHGPNCMVCGFRFSKTYGKLGLMYIHVHHIKPLASIGKEYILDPVNDLIPVCPNCHAMLHQTEPPLTVEELRKIIADAARAGQT